MKQLGALLAIGLICALAPVACGSTELDPYGGESKITNDGGNGADAISQFAISLSPSTIVVGHGESGSTIVTVTRGANFSGAVSITVNGLPNGVVASGLVVPGGATSGALTFIANDDAAVGSASVTVNGLDAMGTVIATASAQIVVGGSAGSLDTTFANGGKFTLDMGQAADTAYVVVVQPDGKMLVAGGVATPYDAGVITRMNADGSLDPTFGTGGKVFMTVADIVTGMALQSDGKIVVTTNYGFTISRYLPNGTLDPEFDRGLGILQLFAPESGSAEAVAVQPDGKIIVVGNVFAEPSDSIYITRRNADGSSDDTFGAYGVVAPQLPGLGSDAWSIALETTGTVTNSIIVGGNNYASINSPGYSLAILKLNGADGSYDTTFGGKGYVLGEIDEWGYGSMVAAQPDGKILIAGANSSGIGVLRYDLDGTLDATFGNGGVATEPFPNTDLGFAGIALQPDGKILTLAAQYGGSPSFSAFELARLNADGSPDTTAFNGNSDVFELSFGIEYDWPRGLTLDASGNIIVVGSAKIGTDVDFAVARLTTAGALDTTFGTNGKITTKIGTGNDVALGSILTPDGSLVLAGYSYNGSQDDLVLVKLTPAGALDASFGTGGIAKVIGGGYGSSIALQDDGKIVVSNGAEILRFLPNGTLDIAFGTAGILKIAQIAYALTTHEGKIFATGPNLQVEEYDEAAGALVTSFGSGGVASLTVTPAPDLSAYGFGITFDAHGNVVVAGKWWSSAPGVANPEDTILARYSSSGVPDDTFGVNGYLQTDFEPVDYARSIAIQSDGHIVVGGQSIRADLSGYDLAIQRYLPNGTRDTTFGGDGYVTTSFSEWDDAFSVLVQPDGKIVGSGSTINDVKVTSAQFVMARYNADGSLDSNFGAGGKIVTTFAPGLSEAESLVRRPDGRLVQVGYAQSARRDYDFAVAQVWP